MDFQATPMETRVNYYGNPYSRTHAYGWESAMEKQVAHLIATDPHEIVFTSGATESNMSVTLVLL
uniref:Aminotransferase class V domain-containing protein n=1 Tax=Oncorhynchus mykiss TaxID=8022 RepID=A0A8C7R1P4_ONCMY